MKRSEFVCVAWFVPVLVFCIGTTTSLGRGTDQVNSRTPHKTQQTVPVVSDEERPPQIDLFGGTGINLASNDGRYQMHLWPGRRSDSWYLFGVFNGNGLNASNDDASMMWMARYQWNFLGRDLPYSQTDVEFREKPTASVALATVRNTSPYTRFSSGARFSLRLGRS